MMKISCRPCCLTWSVDEEGDLACPDCGVEGVDGEAKEILCEVCGEEMTRKDAIDGQWYVASQDEVICPECLEEEQDA